MNGSPAFAAYKLAPDGSHLPFSIQVLDLDGDKIARITYFLDTALFERFGLPPRLERQPDRPDPAGAPDGGPATPDAR